MSDINQTFAGQLLAPGDLILLASMVGLISLKLCTIHFQGSFSNVWLDSGTSYRKLLKLYFQSFNDFSEIVSPELRPGLAIYFLLDKPPQIPHYHYQQSIGGNLLIMWSYNF